MYEFLQASGYAALVYLLFNYLISFGSGRPLHEWINPGRKYLPLLTMALFGGAYTLLIRAVAKYGDTQSNLLARLVNEERAQAEVVGAMSFVIFGLAILLLYIWCWWKLPRDPRTFNNNPKNLIREYERALRHYVRWRGGIDYSVIFEVANGKPRVVAEGAADKDILRGLYRIPQVANDTIDADPAKAIQDQKLIWQRQAETIYEQLPKFDELVQPVRQGHNVTLCFDVRYGAFYWEILERPEGEAEKTTALFIFAATLNEHEVSQMTAGRHFYALSESIRYIRRGISKD